jgi:hypothetical protein
MPPVGEDRFNPKNVQNLCIAVCIISGLLYLALLTNGLVSNSKEKGRDHRIKVVQAIKACSKTDNPALCIAALNL